MAAFVSVRPLVLSLASLHLLLHQIFPLGSFEVARFRKVRFCVRPLRLEVFAYKLLHHRSVALSRLRRPSMSAPQQSSLGSPG